MAPGEETKAERTRTRLLESAVAAFADRGFHGTSTREIAAAAGLSPAAMYVHFPTKEDLLYQLSVEGHRSTLGIIDAAIDASADAAGQLRSVMTAFAEYHARNPLSTRVVNYELSALTPEHRDAVGRLRREITTRLRAIVDAGVASGTFHTDDARTTTMALLSMGIDIARWYQPDGPLPPERIGTFYGDLALRVVDA
ncbi:TetR/AcrR family transcriptional regulator [Gordonia sp. TBRC 11910]|uniref:TetR/AcrR family transcriptional regulator n=1 Tax=Gordonia asplenii TaxID=2725283 RepID=A0A848KUL3_9ACTN|nr:TetR/AcrR family transcriptional regulator [Gordonia asplenii]NMO01707.1 TetR/AcrR family transcriptional regulator [Gordonia asplenii]